MTANRTLKVGLVFGAILFAWTFAPGQSAFPYKLAAPDRQFQLPAELNEISGITFLDSNRVACIQDELGTVYIFDLNIKQITERHSFDAGGDFEGICKTDEGMYVLRSDGRLSEWNRFPTLAEPVRHHHLPVHTSNNEGLCHDPKFNRLLIAAKSKPVNHDQKSDRIVYSYDLRKKELLDRPAFVLNVESLARQAHAFHMPSSITNSKGEVKPFNFRPSAIAVHPVSDAIYFLSATDHMLLVTNRKGEVLLMTPLEPGLFPKPEGIAFLQDGTMLISNEAEGRTASLLVFKIMPKN